MSKQGHQACTTKRVSNWSHRHVSHISQKSVTIMVEGARRSDQKKVLFIMRLRQQFLESGGCGASTCESDVVVQSATSPTKHIERQHLLALPQPTLYIVCRFALPYSHTSIRRNICRLHVRAMASEFKLSATLRGHEEDVSVSSSCDFSITYLIESKTLRPSSISR
jgi:hypothetical protein